MNENLSEKITEKEVLVGKGFFNEYCDEFLEYIDKWKRRNLYKLEEYKILEDEEKKLKEKYPNVRTFFEEKEITDFDSDELKAILDILDIREQKDILEQKLCFKLGIMEEKVFLSEFI